MTFISVREQPRCKDRRGLSATRLGQRQQRSHARRLHPALPGLSSPLPRSHLMLYAATAVGRAGLITRLYQAHVSPAMGLRVACGFPMTGSRHTRALPEKSTSRPCRWYFTRPTPDLRRICCEHFRYVMLKMLGRRRGGRQSKTTRHGPRFCRAMSPASAA